jgi:hypothetical protein
MCFREWRSWVHTTVPWLSHDNGEALFCGNSSSESGEDGRNLASSGKRQVLQFGVRVVWILANTFFGIIGLPLMALHSPALNYELLLFLIGLRMYAQDFEGFWDSFATLWAFSQTCTFILISIYFMCVMAGKKDKGQQADDFMLHAWTRQKGATACQSQGANAIEYQTERKSQVSLPVARQQVTSVQSSFSVGSGVAAATSWRAPYPMAMRKRMGGDKPLTSCCVPGRGTTVAAMSCWRRGGRDVLKGAATSCRRHCRVPKAFVKHVLQKYVSTQSTAQNEIVYSKLNLKSPLRRTCGVCRGWYTAKKL